MTEAQKAADRIETAVLNGEPPRPEDAFAVARFYKLLVAEREMLWKLETVIERERQCTVRAVD